MRYKTLIVEDEDVSRQALRSMVDSIPWLLCVGEASGKHQAVSLIREKRPDVLFLDVRIPGGNGMSVLNDSDNSPLVIFTTAYSKYAVEAFDRGAVDYLLKPFSQKRFDSAIEKLRERLQHTQLPVTVADDTLFVKSGKTLLPISLQDIDYFVSCKDYVVAVSGDEERVLSTTLMALQAQLDEKLYVRVHRSHIVNSRMIRSMHSHGDRQLKLIMRNDHAIIASRSGAARLNHLIWQ